MADTLGTYPEDDIQHELESLSLWIRSFDNCPAEEVRIREEEQGFERPSVLITIPSYHLEDGGKVLYTAFRTCNIRWYGSEQENVGKDLHYEKDRAGSFFAKILTVPDPRYRGIVRIYDFSVADEPVATDYWMFIESGSVDVQPLKDEYGLWMVTATFSYAVERDTEESLTDPQTAPHDPASAAISSVTYRVELS